MDKKFDVQIFSEVTEDDIDIAVARIKAFLENAKNEL